MRPLARSGIPWLPLVAGALVIAGGAGFYEWRAWRSRERWASSQMSPEEQRRLRAGPHNFRSCRAYSDGDHEEAAREARQAIAIDPTWSQPHLNLAKALEFKDAEAAWSELETAQRLRGPGEWWGKMDDLDMHCVRGRLLEKRRDWEGAIAEFRRALAVDPEFTVILGEIALVELRLGRLDDAFRDADLCVAGNRDLSMPFGTRAIVRMTRGQYEDAILDYETAIRIDPAVAVFRSQCGMALSRVSRTEEAERRFREALEIDPKSPDAHMGLGQILADRGEHEEAFELLDWAVEHAPPEAPDIWAARAGLRMKTGDRNGAIEDYSKALEQALPWWPLRAQVEKLLEESR